MSAPRESDVLRLITRLNIGGPARQALLLTRELSPLRTVLAAGRPQPGEGELSDPAVPVTRVSLERPIRPITDLRGLAEVRQLIRRHSPGVVHSHMAKAGLVARSAARLVRPRPRTVHTFHGHVLSGYFGRATEEAFVRIERGLAKVTDVLIAVSPQVRDDLLDRGIGTPEQVVVVPLGFDLTPHLAVEGRRGELRDRLGLVDEPLVGVLGRLAPIKDHDTLLDAIARLPDVHLAVLGDGERRNELTARVDALGLTERVHLLGWWEDVPTAIADLDVVALSSRNEGTPVSLIESLACARPVVSTDVGGVRFVVQDGHTGRLVPAGDSASLADALDATLRDPIGSSTMAAAGRSDVAARFDRHALVDSIRAIYRQLGVGHPDR